MDASEAHRKIMLENSKLRRIIREILPTWDEVKAMEIVMYPGVNSFHRTAESKMRIDSWLERMEKLKKQFEDT